MKRIRDLPIRQKLTLVAILTTALPLALVCLVFSLVDLLSFRQKMTEDLSGLADVIGRNCTASLMFRDPDEAGRILAALEHRQFVQEAILYAPGGRPFAGYVREGVGASSLTQADLGEGSRFVDGLLVVVRPVGLEGEPAGRLVLVARQEELSGRLGRLVWLVGAIFLLTAGLAMTISLRLQRGIVWPILKLAHAARVVTQDRDYSVRVTADERNELGMLTDAFNDMLAQIQAREDALRLTQLELEDRVYQLQSEVLNRRRAEAELQKSREQLLHAQKMEAVGRLAGGIAHDFNNLLTVIRGYSELLRGALESGTAGRSKAEEIILAADRAASLTRQLLAFSRKQILEPKVFDLVEVVCNLENLLRRLIGEDIELLVLKPAQPIGRTKADPGQIEQVIMNLVVNARDALHHGGRIAIGLGVEELGGSGIQTADVKPGTYLLLSVSDNGSGIDPELQKQIFEPFFTTKGVGKGTGLGLSTAYGIIKQSGGHITVESEPGVGTTFRVYLPRLEEPGEASEAAA